MGQESRLNPHAKDTSVQLAATIKDRYRRELAEGDGIIVDTGGLHPFHIDKITPVLDPNAPRNTLIVEVVCRLRFQAAREDVVPEFMRVATAAERAAHKGEQS